MLKSSKSSLDHFWIDISTVVESSLIVARVEVNSTALCVVNEDS